MNIAEYALFRTSLKDILASKILYENGLYPQSLFYFQQASEKANKAYGLYVGSITERDLKKVMHQSIKIQRKQMVKFEKEMKETLDMYSRHPWLKSSPISKDMNIHEYYGKVKSGISFFDKLLNSDLQNITSSILEQTLSELTAMEKENLPSMPTEFTENFKTKFLEYGAWLDRNGKLSVEEIEQIQSDLNNEEKMIDFSTALFNGMELIIQQSKAYLIIIICTLITTQHVSSTRYPEHGKDPLEMYTMKNPIVKLQLSYMALLEKAVENLLTTV